MKCSWSYSSWPLGTLGTRLSLLTVSLFVGPRFTRFLLMFATEGSRRTRSGVERKTDDQREPCTVTTEGSRVKRESEAWADRQTKEEGNVASLSVAHRLNQPPRREPEVEVWRTKEWHDTRRSETRRDHMIGSDKLGTSYQISYNLGTLKINIINH